MTKGIFIALGANLPSEHGGPVAALIAARDAIVARGIKVTASSRIWLTAPVPFDPTQDWYHNAVIRVETNLGARELLNTMLKIEEEFGRVRGEKNASRVLDLDLIAYDHEIIKDGDTLIVPHPRMHERLFVLKPLEDIDKNWTHTESGQSIAKMLQEIDGNTDANMNKSQEAKALDKVEGWT